MRLGGRSAQPGWKKLGIGLLILGLLHVPLPQPDFHNVRHHDAPGEVCEHHDHLLRWHPNSGASEDVAIFHWHWILPTSGSFDLSGPGEGSAIHAHMGDWDAPTVEAGPPVVSRGLGRTCDVAVPPPLIQLAFLPLNARAPAPVQPGVPAVRAFGATFAPHASLPCLFERWAC
jgi:hypothetical protein